LYAYVSNDPINQFDANGEAAAVLACFVTPVTAVVCGVGAGAVVWTIYNSTPAGQQTNADIANSLADLAKNSADDLDNEEPDGNDVEGTVGETDSTGKLHQPLPDIDDIADDDLERTDRVLGESLETRHRESRNYDSGDPNGDDNERTKFRKFRQHQERTTQEQQLRQQVRRRLRELREQDRWD
jgi:hypothetical protein